MYSRYSAVGPYPHNGDDLGGLDLSKILGTVTRVAETVENVARGVSNASAGAQAGMAAGAGNGLFQPTAADQAARALDRASLLFPGGQNGTLMLLGGMALLFFISRKRKRG